MILHHHLKLNPHIHPHAQGIESLTIKVNLLYLSNLQSHFLCLVCIATNDFTFASTAIAHLGLLSAWVLAYLFKVMGIHTLIHQWTCLLMKDCWTDAINLGQSYLVIGVKFVKTIVIIAIFVIVIEWIASSLVKVVPMVASSVGLTTFVLIVCACMYQV